MLDINDIKAVTAQIYIYT